MALCCIEKQEKRGADLLNKCTGVDTIEVVDNMARFSQHDSFCGEHEYEEAASPPALKVSVRIYRKHGFLGRVGQIGSFLCGHRLYEVPEMKCAYSDLIAIMERRRCARCKLLAFAIEGTWLLLLIGKKQIPK